METTLKEIDFTNAIVVINTQTLKEALGTFYNYQQTWFRIIKDDTESSKLMLMPEQWFEVQAILQQDDKSNLYLQKYFRSTANMMSIIIPKEKIEKINEGYFTVNHHGKKIDIYLRNSVDWILRSLRLQEKEG